MNKQLMLNAGFAREGKRIKMGLCPFCSKPIYLDAFRDEVSRREFRVSGMCQDCQDDMSEEV